MNSRLSIFRQDFNHISGTVIGMSDVENLLRLKANTLAQSERKKSYRENSVFQILPTSFASEPSST